MMNDRLIALPEVKDRLSLSRSAIYRLIESGALPAIKIGGATRFSEAAIADFIASAPVVQRGRPRKIAVAK